MTLRTPTELAKSAFARYQNSAVLFLSIVALPMVILVCIGALAYGTMSAGSIYAAGALGFVALTAVAVASLLSSIALVLAIADRSIGTWQQAYTASIPHFGSYLFVSILSGLVIALGFILLIVPGIIFAVWYVFSYFTVLIEGKKGTAALRASKTLSSGRFMAVLGRLVVLLLIYMGCSILISIVVSILPIPKAIAEIFSNVLGLVITPFGFAYLYELYLDLRSVSEENSVINATHDTSEVAPSATAHQQVELKTHDQK